MIDELTYPILQAPVGSVATPRLASAVSRAGALGALAGTWQTPDGLAGEVRAVREAVGGLPFQVNFVLVFPPVALDAALDAGARVVTFSWGDAGPHLAAVRRAGARAGVQVTSAEEAARAVGQGADFLICQGIEAGGHVQSSTPLRDLLPRVLDAAAGVPVVAAGGIASGAQLAAMLDAGAAGAVLGTRFVATRESGGHAAYKQRLVDATGADTVLTGCFDGGWADAPHRVLRNATLDAWEGAGRPPAGRRPREGDVVARRGDGSPVHRYDDAAPHEAMSGDVEALALYAGTGCGAIDDLPSVADLVPRLWAECQRARVLTAAGTTR